jgi:hypothetical protein
MLERSTPYLYRCLRTLAIFLGLMACLGLALSNADWTDEDLEVEQSSRLESVVSGKSSDGLHGKVSLPLLWLITFAIAGLKQIDTRSIQLIADWKTSTIWTDSRLSRHLLGTSPPLHLC